ncbi:MAG TPA: hypothetical protein VHY48_10520 [Acidobacteriaceae bacterium]|jgi:hypothetical protein|nr:hypothetical protein [Acidobacteriaceae bacterium]
MSNRLPSLDKIHFEKRRYEIGEILKAQQLNPTDFRWGNDSTLIHKPSETPFDFDNIRKSIIRRNVRWQVPGTENLTGEREVGDNRLNDLFNSWCQELKAYLLACQEYDRMPDLFAESSKPESAFSSLTAGTENTSSPITPEEKLLIAEHLQQLQLYILNQTELNQENSEKLVQEIGHLNDLCSMIGRKDWINNLVGVLFTLVATGLIPQDCAAELFRHTWELFQFLVLTVPALR